MNEMHPEHEPGMTFKLDQEAAAQEQTTRDELAWELNVRNSKAQAAQVEAHAMHMAGKALYWNALARLITVATLAGVVAGLVVLALVIFP